MIHVGIVGAGAMGRLHARTVAAFAGTQLVWVDDVHPERATALASVHGCGVGQGAADLVVVATPASTHVDVAGRHLGGWVLVEKPLAPTVEQARRLAHPRVLVGHSERFAWADIEDPHSVRIITISRSSPYAGRGGDVDVAADLLVHDLDLVRLLVGRPLDLTGVVGHGASPEDALAVGVRWDGGEAELRASRRPGPAERSIVVDGVPLGRRDGPEDPLTRQLRAVVERMEGRSSAVATPDDGLVTLALVERVRAALLRSRASRDLPGRPT
ncbi:MAG: Gfo/Idh/MocA family oxidoreductase [Alphaproteobacteria bacterium]|nr:Gfo/Idh/MocA family oxidoreductase [Alphaproteobacteria bacterium]